MLNHWHGVSIDWEKRRAKLNKRIDVPLTIIAANGPPIESLRWSEGQERLRELSPNAKLIETGRHHDLHLRQPNRVVSEIKAMLDNWLRYYSFYKLTCCSQSSAIHDGYFVFPPIESCHANDRDRQQRNSQPSQCRAQFHDRCLPHHRDRILGHCD